MEYGCTPIGFWLDGLHGQARYGLAVDELDLILGDGVFLPVLAVAY